MNIPKHELELVAASPTDYTCIQNMGRFYVYDMSEYTGWEIPEDGFFDCVCFKEYWNDPNAHPFIIRVNGEIAGFVIINKTGSDSLVNFNVAQFFILRKFKRRGIGRDVACLCFDRFKGVWEVMVLLGNEGAYKFWNTVISKYTKNTFQKYTRRVPHLDNTKKNIFRFEN